MSKKKKIIIGGILAFLLVIVVIVAVFFFLLTAVGSSNEKVGFTVNRGDSKEVIADNLKEANLIRNKYAMLVYILISGKTNIQAGNYELSRDMSVQDIVSVLTNGEIVDSKKPYVQITFKEGITLEKYMDLLAENTDLEYDTIIEEVNDEEFLNKMIDKYWFLSDEILSDQLYYGLEGYLYPETYAFYKDTTLEAAVMKLLDETDKRLSEFKEQIENSNYTVHEILTMASIAEKEAISDSDRARVAQVIYKRLELNMNLGMDVTTYYGVRKDMKETLTAVDLADENPYNTRVATFIGLPAGPICNPSISSIEAVLNPADTDYVYFFADILTGNVYFTADYNEFLEFQRLYG